MQAVDTYEYSGEPNAKPATSQQPRNGPLIAREIIDDNQVGVDETKEGGIRGDTAVMKS